MNAVEALPINSPISRQSTPLFSLQVHDTNDPDREEIERLIAECYQQRYGATIRASLPMLVSLQINGEILAAAGYRCASEALFLERYLDAPIEHYLGDDVPRSRIVEAGQFATRHPGAGRMLISMMARELHLQGYDWAVSTVTKELHHLFTRIGLPTRTLASASIDRLNPSERADWGSYYEHEPEVCASQLRNIVQQLENRTQ